MRILFVSGEVAPFATVTPNADLIRKLPELLHETGDFEVRIVMPRYGTISERRNRLHEVIRLSGSPITIADRTETLKVKVASIPGIRLQVYFMDNAHYFKRKGVFKDRRSDAVFSDNEERAFFFALSALQTTKNLGWQPDMVVANGWLASFVPMVVKHRLAEDPLFTDAKVVYIPDEMDFEGKMPTHLLANLSVSSDDLDGMPLNTFGAKYADAVVSANHSTDGPTFSAETDEEMCAKAISIFDQVLANKVPA